VEYKPHLASVQQAIARWKPRPATFGLCPIGRNLVLSQFSSRAAESCRWVRDNSALGLGRGKTWSLRNDGEILHEFLYRPIRLGGIVAE